MTVLTVAGWFVGGYLAGSVPFGWLIGRLRGVDIREHGSKNIGSTNCGRVCGTPWGGLAFVLDVAKGFGPVFVLGWWMLPRMVAEPAQVGPREATLVLVIAAVGPILGHTFPVWLRFRGGKAVATSLGVLLAMPMLWPLALAALGLWVIVLFATRYVSVASSAAAVGFVVGYLVFERARAWGDYLPVTVFVLLLVVLVLVRHTSNYKRLMAGTENKFGSPPQHTAAQHLQFGRPPPGEPGLEAAQETGSDEEA